MFVEEYAGAVKMCEPVLELEGDGDGVAAG
jgi:hypothetical protein